MISQVSRLQSATSETARDINRRILLNLIRNRQPVSRADLARLSGLQRSTVSLIVEELVDRQWIVDGVEGRLPRGRRPTYVRLNEQRAMIAVDIRPARTRLALTDVHARILEQQSWPTHREAKKSLAELCRRLQGIVRSDTTLILEGVGVSLPGRLDSQGHHLVFAPNLHWGNVDLKSPIEKATGLEVELENAANACALAEVWFGDHAGIQNLVAVTVSEGIGCGILANGQLLRGPAGMSGEFGHIVLDSEGPRCNCGNRGCWEVLASNTAALRYYSGSTKPGSNFEDLLAIAANGEVHAIEALQKMARFLGRGASLLANGLGLGVIAFVGELTRAWELFQPIIEKEVSRNAIGPLTRVVASGDGAAARLRGTVALLLQKHFGAFFL